MLAAKITRGPVRSAQRPESACATPVDDEAERRGQAHRGPVPAELGLPRLDEEPDGAAHAHGHGLGEEQHADHDPRVRRLPLARFRHRRVLLPDRDAAVEMGRGGAAGFPGTAHDAEGLSAMIGAPWSRDGAAPHGGRTARAGRRRRFATGSRRIPTVAGSASSCSSSAPGYCRAALTLAPHMVNFHGSPHGGVIFSLADFAFGGACNGHGEPAVALTVTIQFHAATARVGRRLVAEARETRQGKRAGFYAMTVTDEADGTVVATCQAVSLRTDAHRPSDRFAARRQPVTGRRAARMGPGPPCARPSPARSCGSSTTASRWWGWSACPGRGHCRRREPPERPRRPAAPPRDLAPHAPARGQGAALSPSDPGAVPAPGRCGAGPPAAGSRQRPRAERRDVRRRGDGAPERGGDPRSSRRA